MDVGRALRLYRQGRDEEAEHAARAEGYRWAVAFIKRVEAEPEGLTASLLGISQRAAWYERRVFELEVLRLGGLRVLPTDQKSSKRAVQDQITAWAADAAISTLRIMRDAHRNDTDPDTTQPVVPALSGTPPVLV